MIRDVVLHLTNEQPLIVDLLERPTASDTVLLCTNVRTMSGTRPIWIDQTASTFWFPISIVRFLEVHPGSEDAEAPPATSSRGLADAVPAGGPAGPTRATAADPDLEIDEDFLRRVREV